MPDPVENIAERPDPLSTEERAAFNAVFWEEVHDESEMRNKKLGLIEALTFRLKYHYQGVDECILESINMTIDILLDYSYDGTSRPAEMIHDDPQKLREGMINFAHRIAERQLWKHIYDPARRMPNVEDCGVLLDMKQETPDTIAANNEVKQLIRDKVLELPPAKYKRLLDGIVENIKDSEIAAEFGMNEAAVRMERHRLLRQLRKSISTMTGDLLEPEDDAERGR